MHALETLLPFFVLGSAALHVPIQGAEAPGEPPPRVAVPSYPNVSCPIMGKPISKRLFVDTPRGRIWVCCKGCDEEILAHVEDAHRTAYPVVRPLGNDTCPVSGRTVGEDPRALVLQGFELALCREECAPAAREDSQAVLARLNDPRLVDLGNLTCPVSGGPVEPRNLVVIDGTIVRLSHAKDAQAAERDPDAVLARARALSAKERDEERREEAERKESERGGTEQDAGGDKG